MHMIKYHDSTLIVEHLYCLSFFSFVAKKPKMCSVCNLYTLIADMSLFCSLIFSDFVPL